jgi:hypothetical protein
LLSLKLKDPSIPEVIDYVIEAGSEVKIRAIPNLGLLNGSKTFPDTEI